MKRLFFILTLFLTIFTANAVNFTASAPKTVGTGEQFQLIYSIDVGNAQNIRLPELNGFQLLANFQNRSQNVQIINGKRSVESEVLYTYTLVAEKEGNYTIPPATITVEGKNHSSNALTINVKKGTAKSSVPASNSITAENLFVRAIPSKVKLYEQDYVLLTYKLYSQVNVVSLANKKTPDFKDFIVKKTENSDATRFEVEVYNGERYNTLILYQALLYPQKSGRLKIGKASFEPIVRVHSTGQMRSLFDDGYQNVNKLLTAPEILLTVDELPAGKPADFNNLAGNFSIETGLSAAKATKNEPITLIYTLSGDGDMGVVDVPKLVFDLNLEVYDPKINIEYTLSDDNFSSKKTIEYLIIPRKDGAFAIPKWTISYFDIPSNSYRTVSSEDMQLEVSDASVNDIDKENATPKSVDTNHLWIGIIVVLLIVFAGVFFYFKKKKQIKPQEYNLLNAQLEVLKKVAQGNDKEQFYNDALKILWNVLGEKLSIPIAALTKENVQEKLMLKNVTKEQCDDILDIWNECEFARYSPISDTETMDRLLERLQNVVRILE